VRDKSLFEKLSKIFNSCTTMRWEGGLKSRDRFSSPNHELQFVLTSSLSTPTSSPSFASSQTNLNNLYLASRMPQIPLDPSCGLKASAKSISGHLINHIQYSVRSWSWIICWLQHEPQILPFLDASERVDLARTSTFSNPRCKSLHYAHWVAQQRHYIRGCSARQSPF
jgi:hypothetical protein